MEEYEVRRAQLEEGRRDAYRNVLAYVNLQLGDAEAGRLHKLEEERKSVVVQLQYLSSILKCGGWPDTLHLRDVLTKYILPAVEDKLQLLESMR